jgi:hypothetical protein
MSGCYEIIIENLDLLTEKSFRDVNKDNDTTLELLISEKTCRFSDRKVPENIKEMLYSDPNYNGSIKHLCMEKFGIPHYPFHPFILENLILYSVE